jgi:hypothetical protein
MDNNSRLPILPDPVITMWDDPGRLEPLPPSTISEVELKSRQDICDACESLKAYICDNCLCFMPIKVRLAETECPLGKW